MSDRSHQPDASDMDEKDLIRRAKNNDAAAFGILYERHLEAIYRYIFFRVGNEREAEDLTEEVFVRTWEALPTYEIQDTPFKSWVYRIARNLVIDYRRKRRPEPMTELTLELTPTSVDEPEDVVALRQDAAALVKALDVLDDEEQQVILLRFVEDMAHKDVAEIIGKSEGASRVIQHRALQKLHQIMSSERASR